MLWNGVPFRRLRVLLGVTAIAAGTAWASGGLSAVRAAGIQVLRILPFVIVGAGVLLLLMAAVPRGRLGGPLLLLVAGTVGLAVEFAPAPHGWSHMTPPAALILGGLVLSLSGRSGSAHADGPIQVWHSFLWPKRHVLRGNAPAKLILRCVLGEIALDLTEIAFPDEDELTFDVTILGGRVQLLLPHNWHVQAGRVEFARAMAFEGVLTSSKRHEADQEIGNLVVLNVQGWLGSLAVTQSTPPPRSPRRRPPRARPAAESEAESARRGRIDR